MVTYSFIILGISEELVRLLIEGKRFKEALVVLEPLKVILKDSAEFWDHLGQCYWADGNVEAGKTYMLKALELNPKIKEGLRLYKSLPRYRKRSERKWAIRLLFKKIKT